MDAVHRHRFVILLGFLALFLASLPVVHQRRLAEGAMWQDVVDSLLYALVMVAAVHSVDRSRALFRLAIALALLGIAAKAAWIAMPAVWNFLAYHVLGILFLALVIYSITGFLFVSRRVDFNMISASLCCYLLLGLMWAYLFSMTAYLIPDAFRVAREIADAAADAANLMHFGAGHTMYPIYYSFVTLTTLGYGDIAPLAPWAQTFSMLEALTGQLYLVVIVSRLVGLHIAHERE